ncbi:ferritin-like domain-containing protein [Advenella mimigardefordensis]|uniref:Ferritin-like domain-containing protein n=1 Tax=Advenella mimigardefordensis (strain DSM 17166 / LMG 22922 / DPN7) TaxID=1247726 RepID=W0P9U6_ADVMD|nr:ferritin-like domain-containing protein [Advenella mimigardefordensis]AHG63629.1 hypothetical protein MIM_c15440 [Advenella mimigardefordensis DPN7]
MPSSVTSSSVAPSASPSLRQAALDALAESDPCKKITAVNQLAATLPVYADHVLQPTQVLPGRPQRPQLVDPREVSIRSTQTPQGKAALMHSIAHIEFNAINLALDIIWRFPGMPDDFYYDWLQVAREEAYHFSLVRGHLAASGYQYGDFSAHNGLWDMAEKTADDILARLALVPRTLEARGLDVSPAIQNKLRAANDQRGVEILDIILRDEIGHVKTGNRWYLYCCEQQNQDPVAAYAALIDTYRISKPRGPFNVQARMAAGFTQADIDWLNSL